MQASFLRSRPVSNDEEVRRASADNHHHQLQQQQQHYQQANGYSFENHFGNFPNFQTNGPQQATLVNNYVFPAENAFNSDNAFINSDNAFNSSDIAFNGSSFNNASMLNDSNIASDSDVPTFGANNETNDADDDLDEKPTDYSLR